MASIILVIAAGLITGIAVITTVVAVDNHKAVVA